MELKELNESKVCEILNEIIEYEMAGVVRYAHSSLMVTGPYRIPIVTFLQEQANESLAHALQAGELITGLNGHPSQVIAPIEDTPAYEAGILAGDYIIQIDDTPVFGLTLNEAVELMRGEKGETIKITIIIESFNS